MKKLPHFKWSSELGGIFASLNFDPSGRPRIEINISLNLRVLFHKQGDTATSQVKNIGRDHRFNDTAIESENSEAKS